MQEHVDGIEVHSILCIGVLWSCVRLHLILELQLLPLTGILDIKHHLRRPLKFFRDDIRDVVE